MSSDTESFRFDRLIATVKRLGSSDLYHVRVVGMGDEFETFLPSENAATAAYEVIGELAFAAHHPHRFFNRRRLAARQSGKAVHEVDAMIDHARKAVGYAERMMEHLDRAARSIDRGMARRLGGGDE